MRLGGMPFVADDVTGLSSLVATLDMYGLSAIQAPPRIDEMSVDEAAEYGEAARSYGLVIGESMFHYNMMICDLERRQEHIRKAQHRLRVGTAMGCKCIFFSIGTNDPSALTHPRGLKGRTNPYMFTDDARREFRDVLLRIVEGADPDGTKVTVEPTNRGFLCVPEDAAEFMDMVDHPSVRMHLDLANMITQADYFKTTELIQRSFDALGSYIFPSAHLKDIHWDMDWGYSLKLDEVVIGEGVLDYDAYLTRLAKLGPDTTCYCEHLATEADYALSFARVHRKAAECGEHFLLRTEAANLRHA